MSMKYDCNKTLDCIHELRRICDYYNECYGRCAECPLRDFNCEWPELTQTDIDILQKWSDEHPEPPKLTRKEHDFLEMLVDDGLTIKRTAWGLCICSKTGETLVHLDWRNFKDIDFVAWTVEELLKLEVEE